MGIWGEEGEKSASEMSVKGKKRERGRRSSNGKPSLLCCSVLCWRWLKTHVERRLLLGFLVLW